MRKYISVSWFGEMSTWPLDSVDLPPCLPLCTDSLLYFVNLIFSCCFFKMEKLNIENSFILFIVLTLPVEKQNIL